MLGLLYHERLIHMLINEIWPENMPNGKYYIVREIQIGSVFFRMKEQAFSVYSKLSWCHSVQAPRSLPAYICYIWCQIDRNMMNVNSGAKKDSDKQQLLIILLDSRKKHQCVNKKWSFILRISSVNVTKSAGNCGFGHIHWRNP